MVIALPSKTAPEAIRDVFTGRGRVDIVKWSRSAPRKSKWEIEAPVKSHPSNSDPLNTVLLRSQSRKLTEVRSEPEKREL